LEFESQNSEGKNNEDSTTPRPKSKDDDFKRVLSLGYSANEFTSAVLNRSLKKKGIPKETFENERKKEFFR
jgi:hypothetical protein